MYHEQMKSYKLPDFVSQQPAPSAFLFCNGSAAYFDERGDQIPELQLLGIKALSEYRKRFPKAPIMWSVWTRWAHEMSENCIESLIEQLRHPYE